MESGPQLAAGEGFRTHPKRGTKRPHEAQTSDSAGNPIDLHDQRESGLPLKKKKISWCDDIATYISLYNDAVQTASQPEPDRLISGSQIGSVRWTENEKDAFFHALGRHGRDDIRSISQLITTKSEPEVQDYLRLLQLASQEAYQNQSQHLAQVYDFSAAKDIPDELGDELDTLAKKLREKQNQFESSVMKNTYGRLSHIDRGIAREIDENRISLDKELFYVTLRQDAAAAFSLLNVSKLISLSKNLFMNSSDPEYCYITYAGTPGEPNSPAIRLPALVDFYRIARSVLERLMLGAHHCASSSGRSRVSFRDVEQAWRIFRLQSPRFTRSLKDSDFWVTAARRNKVNVFQTRISEDDENSKESMSWDEVESHLREIQKPPKLRPRCAKNELDTVIEQTASDTLARTDDATKTSVEEPGLGNAAVTTDLVTSTEAGPDETVQLQEMPSAEPIADLDDCESDSFTSDVSDNSFGLRDMDEFLEKLDTKLSQAHAASMISFIQGKIPLEEIVEENQRSDRPRRRPRPRRGPVDWRADLSYETECEHQLILQSTKITVQRGRLSGSEDEVLATSDGEARPRNTPMSVDDNRSGSSSGDSDSSSDISNSIRSENDYTNDVESQPREVNAGTSGTNDSMSPSTISTVSSSSERDSD